MHAEVYRWIGEMIGKLPRPPASVLELGSRNINGTPRPLFEGVEEYVGVDVQPGPGVDIVADGVKYQHWEPSDLVLCCEVLEHTPAASALVANAVTLAAPGGHVLITCATHPRAAHSAVDGGALHTANTTRTLRRTSCFCGWPRLGRNWLRRSSIPAAVICMCWRGCRHDTVLRTGWDHDLSR